MLKDFTAGNINKLKREYDQRKLEEHKVLVNNLLVVTEEALYLEFGFGNKTRNRFIDRVDNILKCIGKGYVSIDDLLAIYS